MRRHESSRVKREVERRQRKRKVREGGEAGGGEGGGEPESGGKLLLWPDVKLSSTASLLLSGVSPGFLTFRSIRAALDI